MSRSFVEAEYRAMSTTTSVLLCLQALLSDLHVSLTYPIQLHCYNQAALHVAFNPIFHERTKHIEIDCHFVYEQIQSNELIAHYIPTKQQLADIFTKALGKD